MCDPVIVRVNVLELDTDYMLQVDCNKGKWALTWLVGDITPPYGPDWHFKDVKMKVYYFTGDHFPDYF